MGTGSQHIAQGGLELVVFLLQFPKCCDYRHILKFGSVY